MADIPPYVCVRKSTVDNGLYCCHYFCGCCSNAVSLVQIYATNICRANTFVASTQLNATYLYTICCPATGGTACKLVVTNMSNNFSQLADQNLPATLNSNAPTDIISGTDANFTQYLFVNDYENLLWRVTLNASGIPLTNTWMSTTISTSASFVFTLSFTAKGDVVIATYQPSSSVILLYSANLLLLQTITLPSSFCSPMCASETPKGTYYVSYQLCSSGDYVISEVSASGSTVISTSSSSILSSPQSMAIDKTGLVYVGDSRFCDLVVLTSSLSDFLHVNYLCDASSFESPTSVSYDNATGILVVGNYVSSAGYNDNRVYRWE